MRLAKSKKISKHMGFLSTEFTYPSQIEGQIGTLNSEKLSLEYEPAITETVTTQKKFSLPKEIVTQIIADSNRLFQMEVLEVKTELESMKLELKEVKNRQTENTEIESVIVSTLKNYLLEKYKGKFVVISYDKRILESADTRNDLLEKIKTVPIPSEQFFVYGVPLK